MSAVTAVEEPEEELDEMLPEAPEEEEPETPNAPLEELDVVEDVERGANGTSVAESGKETLSAVELLTDSLATGPSVPEQADVSSVSEHAIAAKAEKLTTDN
jgi:hypothetical protein